MKKKPTSRLLRFAVPALLLGAASLVHAQFGLDDGRPAPPSLLDMPVAPEKKADEKKSGTTITAEKEATFDNKERKASFTGNVKVSDPEFDLSCDHLNVFLSGSKEGGDKPAAGSSSALRKAMAEGNVAVVQRRTGDDGVEKEYHGKGEHGMYNAVTGEFVLWGWARVQQGINSHIGTEESTRITITKTGKMLTDGPSRTVIEETPDES